MLTYKNKGSILFRLIEIIVVCVILPIILFVLPISYLIISYSHNNIMEQQLETQYQVVNIDTLPLPKTFVIPPYKMNETVITAKTKPYIDKLTITNIDGATQEFNKIKKVIITQGD